MSKKNYATHLTKANASKLHKATHEALKKAFPMNKIVQEFAITVFDERERQNNLFIDFYISDLSIAIECQGKQHFESNSHFYEAGGLEKQQKNDKLKRKWCEMNDIMLVEITYKEDPTPELILEKISEVI